MKNWNWQPLWTLQISSEFARWPNLESIPESYANQSMAERYHNGSAIILGWEGWFSSSWRTHMEMNKKLDIKKKYWQEFKLNVAKNNFQKKGCDIPYFVQTTVWLNAL